MDILYRVIDRSRNGPFTSEVRCDAVAALEGGRVLLFEGLCFTLSDAEQALLTPSILGGAKNISLDPPACLKHVADKGKAAQLQMMMGRFACDATSLVSALFPAYANRLERARTSFRPAEIESRRISVLRDDTRLHVDAFPTTPMHGRRILRLFANVNPRAPRVWNVGEPFADMTDNLLAGVRLPPRALARLLARTGATKGVRTPYDDLMLALHNRAKRDDAYRRSAPGTRIDFAAGAVWLCFTDQVMHAVLKGQYALERTFYLSVEAMAHPEQAPLRVLERMTGRTLV